MGRNDHNDRTRVEQADPLLGAVLDRKFRIEDRLAVGGFGAIYRARHISSGHPFAIKVVHGRFATDRAVVARFKREGATLTTLRCPHTITAYELDEAADGTLYMVMELLHGQSLFERYAAEGRFEWRRVVKIGREICASLSEAHALGIVHRDLKPTNIHLEHVDDDHDYVKVLDFGIAKILQDSQFDNADLTSVGQMIGTLDYMSPEQMVGGAVTGASDIYTLGIVMYEMIAGRRPFPEAANAATALAATLKTPPPVSAFAIIPVELDRIVMRCLERIPDRRYGTIDEVSAALERVLGPDDAADATRPLPIVDAGDGDDDATQINQTPRPTRAPARAPAAPPPAQPEVLTPSSLTMQAAPAAPAPEQTLRGMGAVRAPTGTVRTPTGAGATVVDATTIDRRSRSGDFEAPPSPRDALIRRVVWIVVLALAAAMGVFAATHV